MKKFDPIELQSDLSEWLNLIDNQLNNDFFLFVYSDILIVKANLKKLLYK